MYSVGVTFYSLIAFDLDDTLAPSKSPMPQRMARALSSLLDTTQVCIISGGQFSQFEQQVLNALTATEKQLENLHLMPTCGTRYFIRRRETWENVYVRNLTDAERNDATIALREEAEKLGLWENNPWGEVIEDRGSQITFSALGQEAPLEKKREWDPTGEKKNILRTAVAKRLPTLEVRTGGSTSVDITRKGVDKAYGITELSTVTEIPIADMLFIGDRLDPDGNDYPVTRLGIATIHVSGWEETAEIIEKYVAKM